MLDYYFKARITSPTLGRFLQVDPIGYGDQQNLYAYVGNDPIDGRDPSGMFSCAGGSEKACDRVVQSVLDARRIIRHSQLYEHGLRSALRNSIAAIGTRGDGNGTTVAMASRPERPCNDACAFVGVSERRFVVFSPEYVSSATNARFSATSIHEFGHIADFVRWGNNNPRTPQESFDTERRYATLGVEVLHRLGEGSYGADQNVSPAQQGINHGWARGCAHFRRDNRVFPPPPCPVNRW